MDPQLDALVKGAKVRGGVAEIDVLLLGKDQPARTLRNEHLPRVTDEQHNFAYFVRGLIDVAIGTAVPNALSDEDYRLATPCFYDLVPLCYCEEIQMLEAEHFEELIQACLDALSEIIRVARVKHVLACGGVVARLGLRGFNRPVAHKCMLGFRLWEAMLQSPLLVIVSAPSRQGDHQVITLTVVPHGGFVNGHSTREVSWAVIAGLIFVVALLCARRAALETGYTSADWNEHARFCSGVVDPAHITAEELARQEAAASPPELAFRELMMEVRGTPKPQSLRLSTLKREGPANKVRALHCGDLDDLITDQIYVERPPKSAPRVLADCCSGNTSAPEDKAWRDAVFKCGAECDDPPDGIEHPNQLVDARLGTLSTTRKRLADMGAEHGLSAVIDHVSHSTHGEEIMLRLSKVMGEGPMKEWLHTRSPHVNLRQMAAGKISTLAQPTGGNPAIGIVQHLAVRGWSLFKRTIAAIIASRRLAWRWIVEGDDGAFAFGRDRPERPFRGGGDDEYYMRDLDEPPVRVLASGSAAYEEAVRLRAALLDPGNKALINEFKKSMMSNTLMQWMESDDLKALDPKKTKKISLCDALLYLVDVPLPVVGGTVLIQPGIANDAWRLELVGHRVKRDRELAAARPPPTQWPTAEWPFDQDKFNAPRRIAVAPPEGKDINLSHVLRMVGNDFSRLYLHRCSAGDNCQGPHTMWDEKGNFLVGYSMWPLTYWTRKKPTATEALIYDMPYHSGCRCEDGTPSRWFCVARRKPPGELKNKQKNCPIPEPKLVDSGGDDTDCIVGNSDDEIGV